LPSSLSKTTDRDAIGLPTLVSFGPVLASSVTSGKYWVTALTGTIVSRGSNGGASSLHAAKDSSAATVRGASAFVFAESFCFPSAASSGQTK
jgi:hypothetical protein